VSNVQQYTVRIHDEDDDGLWAEVVELPGCFASGADMDELRESLAEAMGMYLSTPGHRVQIRLEDAHQVESVKVTQQRVLVS
jgi:predicted RNase H-like HicB family nuclease